MVGVPRSKGCAACRKQKKKVSVKVLDHSSMFTDHQQCTVLSEPPCTRCSRLDISCTGYNELRFKFQDESLSFRTKTKSSTSCDLLCKLPASRILQHERNFEDSDNMSFPISSSDSSKSRKSQLKLFESELPSQLTFIPTNTLTCLIDSYLWSIDAHYSDTSNSLTWNFGAFLEDIPRYLGTNQTLDIAADALVRACLLLPAPGRTIID
jgi:hypothetical protein